MTCPDCRSLNQRFQAVTDKEQVRTVVFKCIDCGCLFAVKTEVKAEKMREELSLLKSSGVVENFSSVAEFCSKDKSLN